MGGLQSVESDDELVVEQWKYNKSTIKAPHQFEIHTKKGESAGLLKETTKEQIFLYKV